MKGNRNLRKLAALLVVAFMALFAIGAAPAPAAQEGSHDRGVFPPYSHPYGHTYGEWAADFFQRLGSVPVAVNPYLDTTGALCGVSQSGPVWYLLHYPGNGLVTRNCTVPSSKALMVAVTFAECSQAEAWPFHGDTEAEMRACAGRIIDPTSYTLAIDGVPVRNLSSYRADTPLYTMWYPEENLLGVPGPGTTPSVGDGIYVMLKPLSVGQHTLAIHSVYPWPPQFAFTSDVTYNVTVGR